MRVLLIAVAGLCLAARAAAPAFDVAYRAWDVVTELSRNNHDPAIGGACAKTFRPFVIAGLKRQSKEDEAVAAQACLDAARSACANTRLQHTPDLARKCQEFR
jgi:hypothetical protein